MGIEVNCPIYIFCDKAAMVCNTKCPESTLKKKRNVIAYHRAHEALAVGIIRIATEDGATVLANLFTELLAAWAHDCVRWLAKYFGKSKRDEPDTTEDVNTC
jgi:hypothetical protein